MKHIPKERFFREAPQAADLTREATARPSTFNETDRTVEAVIASDHPVRRFDAQGEYSEILDVAGADLSRLRGASVLDSHRQDNLDRVIGTVLDARTEGNQIIATIRFSERAAAVMNDVRDGVIKHLSIGYEVSEWRTARSGGRRTKTAVKWTPFEASFVAVPADPNATVRSGSFRNAPDNANTRTQTNREIRSLGRQAGADQSVIDDLIDREASMEEARAAFLDSMISRPASIRSAHNRTTLDNPANMRTAMAEALHLRADRSFQVSEQARQFVGLTIPEMARSILRANGETTSGLATGEVITRALHTTSDFALILGDTVGRSLRASYKAAPSGVRMLARQSSVPDFRSRSKLMLDNANLNLEKVNEAGEFKSGTIEEAGESYRIDTFGRIIGISRQALVNDDIGAFTDLSRRMGQAAAAFEAKFLVDLLEANPAMADGKAVFHADHGNLAGSGGALASDTLSAARLAMRKQTGLGDNLISVTPKYLLVPADLETDAEKIVATITAATTDNANVWTGIVPVVEPRLASATGWYVVADPAEIDGLEYAYLSGAEGPQTESRSGFEVDGVQIRVRLDFGGGWIDHRGWYCNVGA